MQVETIKALFTYVIALLLIVGGGLFLFFYREADAGDVRLIVSGLMGAAVTFVFSAESSTRATKAAAAATEAANGPVDNGGPRV